MWTFGQDCRQKNWRPFPQRTCFEEKSPQASVVTEKKENQVEPGVGVIVCELCGCESH